MKELNNYTTNNISVFIIYNEKRNMLKLIEDIKICEVAEFNSNIKFYVKQNIAPYLEVFFVTVYENL